MGKLLKFESRKLFRQKSLYICSLIFAAWSSLTVVISYLVSKMMHAEASCQSAQDAMVGAIGAGMFSTIAAIVVALIVCKDFQWKTVRNVLTKGYTRNQFYLAKLIISEIAVLCMLILSWIVSFITGLILYGTGYTPENMVYALVAQIFVASAFAALFNMLSFLVRSTGGSIAVGIIVPMVAGTIVDLIDVAAKLSFKFSDLLLSSKVNVVYKGSASTGDITKALITALCYIAITAFIGMIVNKKREV